MFIGRIKTKDGDENIEVYKYNENIPFPALKFDRIRKLNTIYQYATEYITCDTETSKYDKNLNDERLQVYSQMLQDFAERTRGQIINVSNRDLVAYGYDETILQLNKHFKILGKNGIRLSNKEGSKIDTVYDELREASYYELPEVDTCSDMLYSLLEYLDKLSIGYDIQSDLVGWLYQWAVRLDDIYIVGRTPTQFIELLKRIFEHYELSVHRQIFLFIHNLSYDMQYLKHYIKEYDKNAKYFCIDNHTILCVEIKGFRIICSYKLTNLSLDALSSNYSEKYIKAVGEIDYNLVHFQDEELSEIDWYYQLSDVSAQYDGVRQYCISNGYDRIYDIPMTSTGFVRCDCRDASREVKEWRKQFQNMRLTYEQYKMARQCFQGGICICNYVYSGVTLREGEEYEGKIIKLGHKDFTSSYPARQMCDYFPMGKPTTYGDIEDKEEFEYLLKKYCCMFVLRLDDVHIKKGITAPYIATSKCFELQEPLKLNGKLVYAKHIAMIITELDYHIIARQYTGKNMKITDMIIMKRGKLPEWLRNRIYDYFVGKCTLKGVNELLYNKQKNRLNGIYGMTATAILRDIYEMCSDMWIEKQEQTPEQERKELNKYYNSFSAFLPYQWSVYTTAHARYALYEMIEAVGYDNFLYCDTDSVFYIQTEENEKRLEELNERYKYKAIDNNAFYGEKYLGYMEDEPPIRAFRGLHAKCYAMEEYKKEDQEYHLTVVVAGIPKKVTYFDYQGKHTITNAEELGYIDKLEDGFVFKHCGGIRAIYIENIPRIEYIEGHRIECASACILENIEKTISNTMWSMSEKGALIDTVQYY